MKLLHFLKQKRSWQLEPLRLSIYPECVQEADVLTKEGLLWVWAPWMRKVTQHQKFADDSHLLVCLSSYTKCQQKALSEWHASALSSYTKKARILGQLEWCSNAVTHRYSHQDCLLWCFWYWNFKDRSSELNPLFLYKMKTKVRGS